MTELQSHEGKEPLIELQAVCTVKDFSDSRNMFAVFVIL